MEPADVAFRKFLQCAYREQSRWQNLRDQLKPVWKSLYEYDQMYAQVTRENADALFGENQFDDSLLTNLKMKLEIARQNDLSAACNLIQEMRSVFHSVRCALVQLNYDLDPLKAIVAADKATNLRPSYEEMHIACHNLLQGLSQDVCETDYVLQMLTAHQTVDPDTIYEQFPELLARLVVPLKPYLAGLGLKLDVPKSLPSTPKSSRSSLA